MHIAPHLAAIRRHTGILIPILLPLLLLLLPTVALAATYQWNDASGNIHFTDNPDKVPFQFRNNVKTRPSSTDAPRQEPKQPPPPGTPAKQEKQLPVVSAPDIYCGKNGTEWHQEHIDLHNDIKRLKDALPKKEKETLAQYVRLLRSMGIVVDEKDPDFWKKFKFPEDWSEWGKDPKNKLYPSRKAFGNPIVNRQHYAALRKELEQMKKQLAEQEGQLRDLETAAGRCGVPSTFRHP